MYLPDLESAKAVNAQQMGQIIQLEQQVAQLKAENQSSRIKSHLSTVSFIILVINLLVSRRRSSSCWGEIWDPDMDDKLEFIVDTNTGHHIKCKLTLTMRSGSWE